MLNKIGSFLCSLTAIMLVAGALFGPVRAQAGNACQEAISRENRRYTAELKQLQDEAYQLIQRYRRESEQCRGAQDCQRGARKRQEKASQLNLARMRAAETEHRRLVEEITRTYGNSCPRALTRGRE
jgi:hypothetical protein